MRKKLTRRQFVTTTAVGAAAAYFAPALVFDPSHAFSAEMKSRVAMASHHNIVDSSEQINSKIIGTVLDETLIALTNTSSIQDAWAQIFPHLQSTDVIGIKVNCINKRLPSHPEVAYAIAQSLEASLGVNPNNIIIWDRTGHELKQARYTLNTTGAGVRCFGTYERFRIIDKFSADFIGYDESFAVDVGEGTKVHLSKILTEMSTYLINVPVLKDHSIAGVTLSMKNHYGSIDRPRSCHRGSCNPYIAKLNAASQIKDKTKLIVCDALYGMYDGGPYGAPQWINRQLVASTDPVALDYTGMTIIDQQRKKKRMSSVSGKVRYLRSAANIGLGNNDPQKIEVIEAQLG